MRDEDRLLNLQILYERIRQKGIHVSFIPAESMSGLKGIRYYTEEQPEEEYLTVCIHGKQKNLPESGSLLLVGDWSTEEIGKRRGYILASSTELFQLMNVIGDIFVYYEELEKKLHKILYNDSSLKEICAIGVEHFEAPVFVHDEHFYILACPQIVEGLTNFDYNSQAGRYMQDEKTLMMFRTSEAYEKTLRTSGGQEWESDFSDEASIYANIWIDRIYKGRLIVVDSEATPGKLREVGYFSRIVQQAMLNRYVYSNEAPGPFQQLLIDALEKRELKIEDLARKADMMHWRLDDTYICGMVAFGTEEITSYMIFGICNSIQQRIRDSYFCYYNHVIYILVNLTENKLTAKDIRMQMSYVVRESMLHVGVSNVFYHLQDFPVHLKQAEIALRYSSEKAEMIWYHEFREKVLSYWLTRGLGELGKEGMISGELMQLKQYDTKNGTDLYQTLKIYLMQERNNTLTVQTLSIHRSTLPHRLERIEKLTGLNLEDFKVRLYLLMSFAVEDPEIVF